jgi:hypothetical protein
MAWGSSWAKVQGCVYGAFDNNIVIFARITLLKIASTFDCRLNTKAFESKAKC